MDTNSAVTDSGQSPKQNPKRDSDSNSNSNQTQDSTRKASPQVDQSLPPERYENQAGAASPTRARPNSSAQPEVKKTIEDAPAPGAEGLP